MAKIGTAHIEIKPVLDEGALEAIADRISVAVADGVERGIRMANLNPKKPHQSRPFASADGVRDE